MIVWHARTTSVCVFSLKSGGLHTAQWHFQFWLSHPHCLCDLCTRYQGLCRNISSPMPVSFFQCLLLWSTFHMHTKTYGHGQGTHQSDLGADGDVLVVPDVFKFGHCSSGLGYPGQYFRLGSPIWCYSSHIFKAADGLQFLVVDGNVSADAIGVIYHQLGLLCTDLHAICCGVLLKVICQLHQLLLLSS